jgi:hypothetical protein
MIDAHLARASYKRATPGAVLDVTIVQRVWADGDRLTLHEVNAEGVPTGNRTAAIVLGESTERWAQTNHHPPFAHASPAPRHDSRRTPRPLQPRRPRATGPPARRRPRSRRPADCHTPPDATPHRYRAQPHRRFACGGEPLRTNLAQAPHQPARAAPPRAVQARARAPPQSGRARTRADRPRAPATAPVPRSAAGRGG